METAEYDYTDFHRPRAGDEKLAISFFVKAKQDGEASQKEGRPIFKEIEFIRVMIPGDRSHIIIRPVSDQDRGRFGKQYEHWKQTKQNDALNGTPLEAWGILNLAQVEEFKYFGIKTIEHLADLRDDIAAKIPGTLGLREKAQRAVQIMKDEAPMKQMQAQLAQRDDEIATLKRAIEDQAKQLAEVKETVKRR